MGRKSKRDEALIMNCLNMGWACYRDYLMDKSIDNAEKAKLSVPLLAKSMPQEVRKRTDHIVRYLSSLPRPNAIEPPTIDVSRETRVVEGDVSPCDDRGYDEP